MTEHALLTGAKEHANPLEEQMHRAAQGGNTSLVAELVEGGVDLHSRSIHSETALAEAARAGHLEIVQYLVGKGASVQVVGKDGGWTPLHWAARWGHTQTVHYLLEAGADAKAQTTDGQGTAFDVTQKEETKALLAKCWVVTKPLLRDVLVVDSHIAVRCFCQLP